VKEFRDGEGRTWQLGFNMAAVKRLRDQAGVDLLALHEGTPPLIMRLKTDAVLLWHVLYTLLRPAAEARSVSEDQFLEAADADVSRAAEEAFWSSLTDFFRRWGREPQVLMIEKTRELMDAALAEVVTQMSTLTVEEALRRSRDSTPGNLPTRLAASSDSTPGHSLSAS
jgi:hypothetical protein